MPNLASWQEDVWGMEVQIQAFLTMTLDASEGLVLYSSQKRYGCHDYEKNAKPLLLVQPARSLVPILTELAWPLMVVQKYMEWRKKL